MPMALESPRRLYKGGGKPVFSGMDGSAGVRWEDRKAKGRPPSQAAPHESLQGSGPVGCWAEHSMCTHSSNQCHKDPWERHSRILTYR